MRSCRSLLLAALTAYSLTAAGCGSDGQSADTERASGGEAERTQLLDGGVAAFEARLQQLRGTPVVVNQWASWCGPCRYEFPFFQRQARKLKGRVAFLGVDSKDTRDAAEAFLREFPTPFEHFFDPDGSVARVFKGGRAWPTTAYYTADGRLARTHYGAYDSEQDLARDIRRYALG